MALRYIDSFDHFQTADIGMKWTGAGAGASIQATTKRNGTQALKVTSVQPYVTKTLDGQAVWVIGVAFRVSSLSLAVELVGLIDSATEQITIGMNATAGTIRVMRGDFSAGTLLATSVSAVSINTWYYLEFKATIDNSGTYQVTINEADWIASAGGDTQATGNASANVVRIGGEDSYSTTEVYFDDLYICDGTGTKNNDFLGDVRIEALFPDGNGANSDFTPSTPGDNYLMVDEKATDFPDDDTTHVESVTIGHQDTYDFDPAAYAEGETAIDGIQVLICAEKTAEGSKTICPVIREGSTEYDGDNWNPSYGAYAYCRQIYEKTPGTVQDWSPDLVNACEFGHKVVV